MISMKTRIGNVLMAMLTVVTMTGPVVAQNAKPNIVVILADDLGVNDLSCYGRGDQATPNIDRLAGQGVRFTNAYGAQSVCSPSRAAILTGKHPARLHLTTFLPGRPDGRGQKLLQPMIEGQLPLEEITVAELLRGAGYVTGSVGKWHLGGVGYGPKEQGFDEVFAGSAVTVPSGTEGSKGEMELASRAEKFLEENKDRPFFLYLAENSPHVPFGATGGEVAKHAGAFNPVYAAVIGRLDEAIGRVLSKLEALGIAEKTIVILASDNGGLSVMEGAGTPATHNTPYRAGKGFLYEGGLRVPLVVRWPGKITPGVQVAPVVLTDLMPTILEWAGVDAGKVVGPLDGVSLMKLFLGVPVAGRPLFWHFPHYSNQGGRPGGAVREGDWKLIENYEDESVELYDLGKDPGETMNLAETEKARAEGLKKKLWEWKKRVGAQECVVNPGYDAGLHEELYGGKEVSKLGFTVGQTAAQMEAGWKDWRVAMNGAVKGGVARVTPGVGEIRLHPAEAQIHGTKLQYEAQPMKRTLGFWVNVGDWVSWDFKVGKAGKYEVEVLQGCAGGGSEVAVEVGGQSCRFTVENTGHFQQFILRTIGVVELAEGEATLAVKPQTKKGGAVMDLRQVTLRPVVGR